MLTPDNTPTVGLMNCTCTVVILPYICDSHQLVIVRFYSGTNFTIHSRTMDVYIMLKWLDIKHDKSPGYNNTA